MERTKNTDKNPLRIISFWFCGKVIAEPKVTVWIGELNCLKAKMLI